MARSTQNKSPADAQAAEREARRRAAERTDAAGTVTVACRLPCGLGVPVQGFNMLTDGTVVAIEGQGLLRFRGANDRTAMVDESGHGLTSGIDAKAWAALERQHANAPWLTAGAVFAKRKAADARAEAQERAEVNVGFNGVDPLAPAPGLKPDGDTEPAL